MKTYDLTLRTKMRADSPALAREWLRELVDIEAMPDAFEIEAKEETTLPSHGDQHPCALAFHSLNNALQVIRGFGDETEWLTAEVQLDARRLIEEGVLHLAEFQLLFIRQERLIEEQRVENVTLAQTLDRERGVLVQLSRDWAADKQAMKKIEGINSRLVSQHNTARATAQALVEQLRALPLNPETFMRPMSVTLVESERPPLELAQ